MWKDELIRIVPRDKRKPYNMRKVLEMIADKDSLFEIQPTYGRSAITALAPLLADKIIQPTGIIIDAKSGVSGAGRGGAL